MNSETTKLLSQDNIDFEFENLKIRWENFISRFVDISPEISGHKNNVFHHMVSARRKKEKFVEMAENTRPFLSKELWNLMEDFMEFMRNLPDQEGENYRVIYNKMTSAGLVKRLLTKRPIVFLEQWDDHVLRTDPITLVTGKNHWYGVAKNLNKPGSPCLRDYISYDEILLSACVNMSTPTFFVSDGSLRDIDSKPENSFIPEGILCGLVGARLEKPGFMEHRFVFPKDPDQENFNFVHKSDEFWIKKVYFHAFPEGKIPTKNEIKEKPEIYREIYVNGVNVAYLKKRVSFSVIPYILEAIARGKEMKREVVVTVPPIGAGVWRGGVPADTISRLINTAVLEFLDNDFELSDLHNLVAIFLPQTKKDFYENFKPKNKMASIRVSNSDSSVIIDFKESTGKSLTIFNLKRFVAQLLPEKFSSALNIAGYAWDGNSYPGNEYWIDSFSSFDPQAVLCSNLGQFQNPDVNEKLSEPERIKIY